MTVIDSSDESTLNDSGNYSPETPKSTLVSNRAIHIQRSNLASSLENMDLNPSVIEQIPFSSNQFYITLLKLIFSQKKRIASLNYRLRRFRKTTKKISTIKKNSVVRTNYFSFCFYICLRVLLVLIINFLIENLLRNFLKNEIDVLAGFLTDLFNKFH